MRQIGNSYFTLLFHVHSYAFASSLVATMASGLSVPRPKRKGDLDSSDLPKFDWENFDVAAKIGQGSYGTFVTLQYTSSYNTRIFL